MIRWVSLGYLIFVAALWLVIRLGGDLWWPATLILFGPRWISALPLFILLPLALWKSLRSLFLLLAAALIAVGPFMGLCLPLDKAHRSDKVMLHILTCNIDGNNHSKPALSFLIQASRADIVALQECPKDIRLILPPGWQMFQDGELSVLSRYPLKPGNSAQALHLPHKWPRTSLLKCTVQMPEGDVSFCTVHLPSPRYGLQTILDRHSVISLSRKRLLEEETTHRRQTSMELSCMCATLPQPVIIAGDFNMPIDSTIYRKFWGGYSDAFLQAGAGFGWTVFESVRWIKIGARIDHVLTGKGLGVINCHTGPDIGSDHLPLIADVVRL